MRGDDELDVHHCFFVYLDNLEAVLSDQLVEFIEVFGELYDVFGVGVFGDQVPTV